MTARSEHNATGKLGIIMAHIHSGNHWSQYRTALAIAGFGVGCLIAFVLIGPPGLIAGVVFAPAIALLSLRPRPGVTLPLDNRRPFILGCLSHFLGQIGHPTVAMVVEIDDYEKLVEIYGSDTLNGTKSFVLTALQSHLTEQDIAIHLDGPRFAVALAPLAEFDTETMLNTCTRIQHALVDAPLVTKLPRALTASIGFAVSDQLERPTSNGILQAALTALSDARGHSPNTIRGFSKAMSNKRSKAQRLARQAKGAFEKGEIFAHFQPQIRIKDGSLCGFEALTRWHHPEYGIIAPTEFLPALAKAGMMQNLGDTMIQQATQALTFWDKSGLNVPRIAVNFSTAELRDPYLVDRISTGLDASGIAPHRLCIEIQETDITRDADENIAGNLGALADLGCSLDLDNFGVGSTSINNIRQFGVKRIKIDRLLISGIETDSEKRRSVAAIQAMADSLGVATMAECVETRGARDALAVLDCHNAQGFYFARPMPIQETLEWATAYFAPAAPPVHFSKRAG